jgi:carboxypeptidase Taq
MLEKELRKELDYVNKTMSRHEMYSHAGAVIGFDLETVCPEKGLADQSALNDFLADKDYRLLNGKKFVSAYEDLYAHLGELGELDKVLISALHRQHSETKNIPPELQKKFNEAFSKSYMDWLNAKKKSDFSLFRDSLEKVREINLKQIELNSERLPVPYDNLLNRYERGMTTADLDAVFSRCKERLIPLLKKIVASKKNIRKDFLSVRVKNEEQREMTDYLLDVIGFDKTRGSWALTEHPFTNGLYKDDARITTHFYPNMFYSSMFSVIHEGGHALFEQNQPRENYVHHIQTEMTMGMHESVSRFYENRIGRSKEFIHLIYPKTLEIFPELNGVSEKQLYEGMNIVTPSLIRTEADEFTYTFHIIIRYEIEKELVNNRLPVDRVKELWNAKYKEYLGIEPDNDRDGVLQDIHWASGFGYFPTYALGNMYNAMYFNTMKKALPVAELVEKGDFKTIDGWMKDHVFLKANRLDAKSWIRDITGRDFTPDDFLDYLEEKYTELYELD